MSTRLTAAQDGSATLYGLTAGHEYDVTATDVTPAPSPAPSGIVVPKVPVGVPGSWVNVFADAFAAPFGTGPGQNNRWWPNRGGSNPNEYRPGDNSNELQVYNASMVSQDAEGLRLRCQYSPNVGGTGKNYVGATIRQQSAPPGYSLFKWKPTAGQAWCFEIKWKLPKNTGEMDPAFWSTDPPWTAELDHPELWGWPAPAGNYYSGCPVWIYATPSSTVRHESYNVLDYGFDPTAGFHRFTTTLNADGSLDFYADGVHKWKVGAPGGTVNRPMMGLIVQNALRKPTKSSGFTSGYRDLQARYVTVYTDSAHATQNFQNGGLAPGTVLG